MNLEKMLGTLASALAGASTTLGALPVFVPTKFSGKAQSGMMGFGAGVMMSAAFFSLLAPALEKAKTLMPDAPFTSVGIVSMGVFFGAVLVFMADHFLPHEHFFKGKEGRGGRRPKRAWLFVLAIAIHNFPEGLAVGVGFGDGEISNGLSIMTGISLQNLPEGLVAALALISAGYSRAFAFGIAASTGMIETIGGFIGIGAVTLMSPLIPFFLAFAAGAMIYVVSKEVIPESHRNGFELFATWYLVGGFVLMMFLDTAFG